MGEFYQDIEHKIKYVPYEYKIYINIDTSSIYVWNGENYISAESNVPYGSDTVPGIIKLYQSTGNNTDGSISQKTATEELNKRFKVTANEEEETISLFNN